MRYLLLALSLLLLFSGALHAADDLDPLLQHYSVSTKTLLGTTKTLVSDIQSSHSADEAATRIEAYTFVYHEVADAFKNVMPAYTESKSQATISALEKQSMIESSQRMSEVGKILTSQSDDFDHALHSYQEDPRVQAALTAFSEEGQALQAVAEQYK